MAARRYGTTGLKANEDALAHVGSSEQDATLLRQYLHVLRGADREHGPHIAQLQAAYIARAQKETGWTFAGFVARLVETWAAENAR